MINMTQGAAAQQMLYKAGVQVAAIGFCMGGALAIAASQYGKIEAAVGCYGLPQYDICPVSFQSRDLSEGSSEPCALQTLVSI